MNRIEAISIRNFRGIREGKIESLADVNLLVGRNNSGKTTVLEAVSRVASVYGGTKDILGRKIDAIWSKVRPSISQDLMWYRQNSKNQIEIGVSITGRWHSIKISQQSTHQVGSVGGSTSVLEKVTIVKPQDVFDNNIEKQFWPKLLADRRDKFLTSTLNEVFNLQAESFQMINTEQLLVLYPEYSVPLDSQGDGTRTALRTIMVLAMMRSTVLMLEEPECYQHPGSLERFAIALCKLAKQQEVQLIISTHSSECVRAFLKGAKVAASEAALFHLKLEDGQQEARRLNPEAIETLSSSGVDVRFLDLYA